MIVTPGRMPNPIPADEAAIQVAVAELAAGRLVAFPTETVYGLGADAAARDAVAAVYRLKGRPAGHPLIVHVTGARPAQRWARWSDAAQRLAEAFWPGPLTLIVKRLPEAPSWACGEQDTVGLRAPAHPVARALLAAFERQGGMGVAAPSANRFGRVSPTRAEHVIEDLGGDAPLVLDGGACEVGVESTIVDLSRSAPALLRPGGITASRIEAVLGDRLRPPGAAAPRASGTMAVHYAPLTRVELLSSQALALRLSALSAQGLRVAVWSLERPGHGEAHWEPAAVDPARRAQELYDTLRRLDRRGFDRLLIERTPDTGEWQAVSDRLRRAAAGASAADAGASVPGAGAWAADAGVSVPDAGASVPD